MSTTFRRATLRSLGAAPAAVTMMAGCGSQEADMKGHAEPDGTHTMSDGTEMKDSEMEHHSSGDEVTARPSAAARMVCGGDVAEDVERIMGLESAPDPAQAWSRPMFTCTYALAQGPLVLSVHDADRAPEGRAYFEQLRGDLGRTESLRGMYGLGLPAFETDDGTVVFIRDGKTLRVDATALPGRLGPDKAMSQTDLAYAVATSVLACWTEHT